jgi:hypothetical protein
MKDTANNTKECAMTQKDYELIAHSIQQSIQVTEWSEKNRERKNAKLAMAKLIANGLAGTLYGQDKKFNQSKFLQDCGVEE